MTNLKHNRYTIGVKGRAPINKITTSKNQNLIRLVIVGLVAIIGLQSTTYAATLEEQIRAANQAASQQQAEAASKRAEGNTLAGKLASINAQSAAIRAQLAASQAKQNKLTADIENAKAQLAQKKQLLDESVRQMYQEAQISPLEMLASSKNFSDYVDRQQYRDSIKDHVQTTAIAMQQLKSDLERQQADVAIEIRQQGDLSLALAAQQREAATLLEQTRGEEAQYAQLAKASKAKASQLEAQQRAILAAQFGGNFGGGGGGPACGGGYPGKWCNVPRDSVVDSWGMYNRECVGYTAFRVAASGRKMPYWGGRGNANQWPANARGAGIPVDGNPRVGDVAVSMAGPYGHVMYVEAVLGNGKIHISQYNAAFDGNYSEATISSSGLQFIHF